MTWRSAPRLEHGACSIALAAEGLAVLARMWPASIPVSPVTARQAAAELAEPAAAVSSRPTPRTPETAEAAANPGVAPLRQVMRNERYVGKIPPAYAVYLQCGHEVDSDRVLTGMQPCAACPKENASVPSVGTEPVPDLPDRDMLALIAEDGVIG